MPELLQDHEAVLRSNQPIARTTRTDSNGDPKWWLSHHFPIPALDDGRGMVGTIAIDVTERTLQEERIARLSRIHAVLSGINALIVRARSRDELLQGACRIAVEAGQLKAAWVGLVEVLLNAGLHERRLDHADR